MTSKLQLTVPKAVADEYGIRPGDELEWIPAGDSIRIVLKNGRNSLKTKLPLEERLKLFDQATERQRLRNQKFYEENGVPTSDAERDWKREDLYTRGFPR